MKRRALEGKVTIWVLAIVAFVVVLLVLIGLATTRSSNYPAASIDMAPNMAPPSSVGMPGPTAKARPLHQEPALSVGARRRAD